MAKKLSLEYKNEDMVKAIECKIKMPIGEITSLKGYQKYCVFLEEVLNRKAEVSDSQAKRMISQIISSTAKSLESYEKSKYKFESLKPFEILKSFMEDFGFKQRDMALYLGSQSIVSEVLGGKRNISMDAAKRLGKKFSVSPTLFLDLE